MGTRRIKAIEQSFSEIDIRFGRFISKLSGSDNPAIFLASILVSRSTGSGHVCLDLSTEAQKPIAVPGQPSKTIECPGLSEWTKALRAGSVVGAPGDFKPLILDSSSRLYLFRYWEYEQKLAAALRERAAFQADPVDKTLLKDRLSHLFLDKEKKLAAFAAVMKNFAVICGGPGTGKTTTVAKILAVLIELAQGDLTIKLAAPTGKAADRLQQAVKKAKKEHLKDVCPDHVREAIPDSATTLHRLLGTLPGSPYFRYNAENRLAVDVVVIDEASMVDLPLMSKLFQATPSGTKIIILGDKDQLASVESGSVLGDICMPESIRSFSSDFSKAFHELTQENVPSSSDKVPELHNCFVELKVNHRFGPDSGIGRLSVAVKEGNADSVRQLLRSEKFPDISWLKPTQPGRPAGYIKELILDGFTEYLEASSCEEALNKFEPFRILCVLKEGPFGVSTFNRMAEKILAEHKLINPVKRWYHGRPVIITQNDYNLKLFNGDVGIILNDPEDRSSLRAFFAGGDGFMRTFLPARLPEHETVYAMTVHKSQGSEFDKVLLVLPSQNSPILTRELLYTAVTRARKQVLILGGENILQSAVTLDIQRTSGLRDALCLD